MPRFQLIVPTILALALGLFASSSAWAGSAIDQYVESVPSADGKGNPTQESGGGGDSPTDRSSADGPTSDRSKSAADGSTSGGGPSASDLSGLTSDEAAGNGEDGDGSIASLTPEHVSDSAKSGFAGSVSSGLGSLGLILGGSLLLTLGGAAMIARRGHTE